MILCPSGDQVASVCGPFSSGRRHLGPPPSDETRYVVSLPCGDLSVNRICVPSGDQRGNFGYRGGSLSCTRPLPSRLALHRMPSGKETYATDWPSLEKDTNSAEMPPR